MFHLKLIKSLSYAGIVTATKKKPDVYVEDEATAKAAVASGYFAIVEDGPAEQQEQATVKGHLDKAQLEEMKIDDLKKLAADMGINTSALKKKAELVEAIASVEVEAAAEDDNEVDYGEDAGSPTMIELQRE